MSDDEDDIGYGLVRSFSIDDGELEGLSSQECFVLGYELATVDHKLTTVTEGFTQTVHSENITRIQEYCSRLNRSCTVRFFNNDKSESWAEITIARQQTEEE